MSAIPSATAKIGPGHYNGDRRRLGTAPAVRFNDIPRFEPVNKVGVQGVWRGWGFGGRVCVEVFRSDCSVGVELGIGL